MHITLVKKVLSDGSPCAKCREVEQRLRDSGQLELIDETLVADERDPDSPGMVLARKHQVSRAPFFIVEGRKPQPEIFSVYFKLAREVLPEKRAAGDAA